MRRLAVMIRVAVISLIALAFAAQPMAAPGEDGRGEVRVAGVCGTGAKAKLRLKASDNGIEVRFELEQSRASVVWRVVLVHEHRVAWKGAARTTRARSFELRRTLPDLPGSDTVTARAWGPRGVTCRATATLVEA